MIRVHLPAGHNDTDKRFARTSVEAFGCGADEAIALHKLERRADDALSLVLWLAASGLGAAALYLLAHR